MFFLHKAKPLIYIKINYFLKTKKGRQVKQVLKALLILFSLQIYANQESKPEKEIALEDYENIMSLDSFIEHEPTSEVLDRISQSNVQFVMLVFTDIFGNLKELSIPVENIKKVLAHGLELDASNIPGFRPTDTSVIIKPDASTLRLLPWTDNADKTALFICNIYKNQTEYHELDGRHILQKNIQKLNHKYDIRIYIGAELDFFTIKFSEDAKSIKPEDNKGHFDPEFSLMKQQENHIIMQTLKGLDIHTESLNHENSPGKYKLIIKKDCAINLADQIIITKHALKVIGLQLGYMVTFMPKPFSNQEGNSMTLKYNFIDCKTEETISYKEDRLSKTTQQFIAGNINYLPELTAITNPTINSYKRLAIDKNCDTTKIINDEETLTKQPDPSANPYLVLASIIATGIEGIKIETQDKDPDQTLPESLYKALDKVKQNKIAQKLLTKNCLTQYIATKKSEIDTFNKIITDWEIKEYL